MSYLDNLENNLKALESQGHDDGDDRARREKDRNNASAAAPWAERLKSGPWTQALMREATKAGFQRRVKVNLIWIGTALRLEALGRRMELRPGADGVTAVFLEEMAEVKHVRVSLESNPADLIAQRMVVVDQQKRRNEERSREMLAAVAEEDEASA